MKNQTDAKSAAAVDPVVSEEAAGEPVSPRRSRRRTRGRGYWLWLSATSIVIGSVLSAGVWMFIHRQPVAISSTDDDSAPVAVSLPAPPPLALAIAGLGKGETAIAADCQRALSKMSLIAEAFGPDLQSVAAASADAIALPDQRVAGQGVPVPAYQRWEVRLAPGTTLETYAHGLDHFGIELGIIGGAKEIVYLSKFSQPKPEQRVGPSRKDHRIFMLWRGGGISDEVLAMRAGLNLEGKIVAQFFPPEIEQQLAELERAYAEEHQHKTIEKTTFAIKAQGDGFVFYVMDQQSAAQTVVDRR